MSVRCLIWLVVMIGCSIKVQAQKELLAKQIKIPSTQKPQTQKNFLDFISSQCNVVFTYNANLLKDDKIIEIDGYQGDIGPLIHTIFSDHQLLILTSPPNKIILHSKGSKVNKTLFLLSGNVVDQLSGEYINGAIVVEQLSNTSVISNDKGYYIMEVPAGKSHISVRYLGYKNNEIDLKINNHLTQDIYLENNNELPVITINEEPSPAINFITSGEIIDVFKTKAYKSIIGDKDIINNTRILPGVQSGGEGQSGLYVRGGSADQNLILLEGVALYETSHTAGISSIFMDESIKEVSFIRNGFPARYGGRLSSVMDIQLKDGDKKAHQTAISIGLPGAKIHFNGPIYKKTSYTITARTSWLNFYVNNLVKKYTKYDDINIAYNDILTKVTHHFSTTNSLSLALYSGSDKLNLTKNDVIPSANNILNVYDRNGISWGNKVASLKWNVLLNDKTAFKLQTGILSYKNGSRSSYSFSTTFPDSTSRDELDVITSSNIKDINLRAELEYYQSDKHVFRIGTNLISHRFNPTLKQSTVILQGSAENIEDKDSVLVSSEYNFFAEDNFKINTSLFLYGGIHAAFFKMGNASYQSLQPRLKLIWSPSPRHQISGAFSRMSQFVHLLSNSGLGLPSDLWVPSTDKIAPQFADQWSVNYSCNIHQTTYISLGAYTKLFKNSLEYTTPVELFYFLINNQNIVPVFNKTRDWQRNLLVGSSKSRGIELLIHKREGSIKAWLSCTYAKTDKTFEGLTFPATYDRRWDINTGLIYRFSDAFSLGSNFVYGTGNTFSLATEAYDSFLGIELLKSSGRNNYRLPSFHQLSFNANYLIKGKFFDTSIDFNIYNVYNKLNTYFIYIYKNPEMPGESYLKKVSILPFTPSINVSIKF
ncbi:MAG: TonB-dependent receptor [Saprospiraceae bacterium]|nr:TonB-dependent receptor [Saprospiraceae bacterium]